MKIIVENSGRLCYISSCIAIREESALTNRRYRKPEKKENEKGYKGRKQNERF